MNKETSNKHDVDALLAKDSSVSQFPFEEFRMNLESSIQNLEERANRVRRWTHYCAALWLLSFPGLFLAVTFFDASLPWLKFVFSAMGIMGLLAACVVSAIYQYKYQPAMAKAKDELLSSTILQIQQQVADIQQKMSESNQEPKE